MPTTRPQKFLKVNSVICIEINYTLWQEVPQVLLGVDENKTFLWRPVIVMTSLDMKIFFLNTDTDLELWMEYFFRYILTIVNHHLLVGW